MIAPFDFQSLAPPRPSFMGIVNITPNSFSDGGQFFDPAAAIAHARQLAQDGAQLLDLGAEASSFFRPGVTPIDADEQLRRLLPVIPALHDLPNVPLSIDTRSARVARETLAAGAHIINDISAGTHDADMLPTVAAHNASIILMHIGPTYPAVATVDDADILKTVHDYLAARIAAAESAGIPQNRIAIDPGIGFGKTVADQWTLALHCHQFSDLGVPILLGASRKRFLDTPPPPSIRQTWQHLLAQLPAATHPRDPASAALTAITARQGIPIHRLHNVTLARSALTM